MMRELVSEPALLNRSTQQLRSIPHQLRLAYTLPHAPPTLLPTIPSPNSPPTSAAAAALARTRDDWNLTHTRDVRRPSHWALTNTEIRFELSSCVVVSGSCVDSSIVVIFRIRFSHELSEAEVFCVEGVGLNLLDRFEFCWGWHCAGHQQLKRQA